MGRMRFQSSIRDRQARLVAGRICRLHLCGLCCGLSQRRALLSGRRRKGNGQLGVRWCQSEDRLLSQLLLFFVLGCWGNAGLSDNPTCLFKGCAEQMKHRNT